MPQVTTTLVAHAFHDATALGVPLASLALAAAGIIIVSVVLPARAEEDRLLLPVTATVSASTITRTRTRGLGLAAVLTLAAAGIAVGAFGLVSPNLAASAVAWLVVPVTVVLGLATGGPAARWAPEGGPTVTGVGSGVATSDPEPVPVWVTAILAVPLALAHPLGGNGGRLAAGTVAVYLVASGLGRWRFGTAWWSWGDPLALLARTVGRLSPRSRAQGGRRRWPVALAAPLPAAERAVVGVLLAGTLAHAARFLPGWAMLTADRDVMGRVLFAALLFAYVLALLTLLDRAVRGMTGRDLGPALVPLLVAFVLANDAAAALFTLDYAGTLLSDPLGTGADLFGTADRRVGTGVLLSPLTWAFQLVTVLLGGVLAATVQRDRDRADGVVSRTAPIVVAGLTGVAVALLLVG